MATENFKRRLLLILYREGKKKILTFVVCFLLPLNRERKNVCHLQLVFLPVTLSKSVYIAKSLVRENRKASSYIRSILRSKCNLRHMLVCSLPGIPDEKGKNLMSHAETLNSRHLVHLQEIWRFDFNKFSSRVLPSY